MEKSKKIKKGELLLRIEKLERFAGELEDTCRVLRERIRELHRVTLPDTPEGSDYTLLRRMDVNRVQ